MAVSGKRQAKIEITSSAAGVDKGLDDARRKMRGFQRETISTSRAMERDEKKRARAAEKENARAMRAASGLGRNVVTGMSAAAGLDLAGGISGFANETMDFEKDLTRLQITGEMSAAELAEFRGEVTKASTATGLSRKNVLAGASAYIAFTGNAKNAKESLELFSEVAQATGGDVKSVAGIAATLDKNFHLDPNQWRGAFDILIKQGHEGGVELADLADRFASVGAAYSTFAGGATLRGLAQVSSLAQVLQNMTHDSDLTSTYLKDMFSDLKKNAPKLREFGIEPFKVNKKTGVKEMRDVVEILDEISKSKIAKDPELLQKVFGEIRGRSAVEYLTHNLDAVHKLAEESEHSNQLAKDFGTYTQSSAGQTESAMNRIKLSIDKAFSPRNVELFAKSVDAVATAIENDIELIDHLTSGRWKSDAVYASEAAQKLYYAHEQKGDVSQADLVQQAKEILAAGSTKDLSNQIMIDRGAAGFHLEDMQTASRDFLVKHLGMAPGWDFGSKREQFGDVFERTQKMVGYSGNPAQFKRDMADAFLDALKRAGVGEIKIGNEPVHKAVNNSVLHRTRPGGR